MKQIQKPILILIILILFFFGKTYACLNGEILRLKNGTILFEDREGLVPYGHIFNTDEWLRDEIKTLDNLYKIKKDLDYLSDKGLLLILLKQYDQAIKLYLEIEKMQPNRYSTASNIGTAYELMGQNENALMWIKKSVKIDPKSHENSEWIHVKILEAKIKGQQFYTTNFLLNTDFGTALLPKTTLSTSFLLDLHIALYYQLNERISFVKPEEKIVAQLLFDLGNMAFIFGRYDNAKADFEQAKKYGFSGQLIENRVKETEKMLEKQMKEYDKASELPKTSPKERVEVSPEKIVEKNLTPNYLLYGAITVISLILLVAFIKRKNN